MIKVEALAPGYINHKRYSEGEVFHIHTEKELGSWMKRLGGEAEVKPKEANINPIISRELETSSKEPMALSSINKATAIPMKPSSGNKARIVKPKGN